MYITPPGSDWTGSSLIGGIITHISVFVRQLMCLLTSSMHSIECLEIESAV
eukprot:COSAG02_NODE_55948_length_288_cov_0.470899_1_plen_50_part_01